MTREMAERYRLYGEKVADGLREMYETETGDKLDIKDDYTKVLEYCGCEVMLEDIPVFDAIIKLNDAKYAVIFNEEAANNLKEREIGSWNIKLMSALGRIIFNHDVWSQKEIGAILYLPKYYDSNEMEQLEKLSKSIVSRYSGTPLIKKPKKDNKGNN